MSLPKRRTTSGVDIRVSEANNMRLFMAWLDRQSEPVSQAPPAGMIREAYMQALL